MMGGRIWLESEPGEGSTFYFIACFEKGAISGGRSQEANEVGVPFIRVDISDPIQEAHGEAKLLTTVCDEAVQIAERGKLDSPETKQQQPSLDDEVRGSAPNMIRIDDQANEEDTIQQQERAIVKLPSSRTIKNQELIQDGSEVSLALLKGMKVLLAEDNLVNQKVACQQLRKFGTMVEVVGDGQQCIDVLDQQRDKFDLILMDVQVQSSTTWIKT
jgi:hypothetical protein